MTKTLVVSSLLAGCSGPYSTLDPAGPSAQLAASLWWGMFAVSVVVMAFIVWLWWHALRHNPTELDRAGEDRLRDRWILAGGIALPTVSIVVLLAFGIPSGHRMLPLPDEERAVLRIDVQAHRWYWRVSYPDYGIELIDEIHIPVDTPVDFHIGSADVIHGFWVPRLGGKIDAIPGRINVLRLEASQPGEYGGLCAEFCGSGHAHMAFGLIAHGAEGFASWLTAQGATESVMKDEAGDE